MSHETFLSACLIVRDAAEDLAWCLESIADEVDEIVVVDTGSQDATRQIARRFTKHVFPFAWQDDFSAARNFALSKVHGRWAFCIDSDERLQGEKGALRRAVKGAEGLGEKALSLLRHEVDEEGQPAGMPDNPAVRLLRRGGGLAYHDPIHEYLAYPDGRSPEAPLVPPDELSLLHRGYAPSRKAAKAERNIRILEHVEDAGEKKLYLHYYLAGLYLDQKRYKDAVREAELSITAQEHPTHGALDVWRNYAIALGKLGRDEELEELCERGIQAVPELPDLYAQLGVMAMNRNDYALGERYLAEALAREKAFPQECPNDYDTFRAIVPQVENLLKQCRTWTAGTAEASVASAAAAADTVPARSAGGKEAMQEERGQQVSRAQQAEAVARAEHLAELLPAAARTVVVFGHGLEAAARVFLRRSPEAHIYGFTPDRAEALAAGRVMTGAFVGEPTTVNLADYGLSDVECIAYFPSACAYLTEACLRRHQEALMEQGQMVCLAPNPLYIGRMLAVGAADMPCQSPLAIAQMMSAAGMAQMFVLPEKRPEDARLGRETDAAELMKQLNAYAEAHGLMRSKDLDPFAEAYRIRAARKKVQSALVQTLIGESTVTARVRVQEPDSFCSAEAGWFAQSSVDSTYNAAFAKQVDASIIVQQRMSYKSVEAALAGMERLRSDGHLSVYEIDDNPVLWKGKIAASKGMDFIGVHAVQVSTPALAEYVRQFNPHVLVFENHLKELPAPRDYAAEERARDGRVTIFFGAVNREPEWREIVPLLNEAAERYGDKLQFLVLADQPSYEMLHAKHKTFVGDPAVYDGKYVSYPTYQRALHAADISLLPLRDTEFNRAKSDLKFIESAGHGAVALASPVVYERTMVDGCTGCIYRSPEEFSAKLARLIEDAPYRHAIAQAAYGYVRQHRLISQHYRERIAAYRWMIAHREELDRDLLARVERVRKGEA